MSKLNKELFFKYPRATMLFSVLGVLCLLLVGMEFALRVEQFFRTGIPISFNGIPGLERDESLPVTQFDRQLGWVVKPEMEINKQKRDLTGNEYTLHYLTDAYGFRLRDGRQHGILFVGDSFTQTADVSNQHTYYAEVARLLPEFPVSGIGVTGYGTLQEIMLTDRIFSLVNPSIIVFQMSVNDLLDNSFNLLCRASLLYPLFFCRPYWENHKQVYHGRYLLHLATKSRLFYRLYIASYSFFYAHGRPFVEKRDGEIGLLFDASSEITGELFQRERERRPDVKFFAYSLENNWCYNRSLELLEKAATSAGFVWLGHLGPEVDTLLGESASAADGIHFNALGNRLIGALLAQRMRGYLEDVQKRTKEMLESTNRTARNLKEHKDHVTSNQ